MMHVYVLYVKKKKEPIIRHADYNESKKKKKEGQTPVRKSTDGVVGLGLMPSRMPNMLGLLQPYARKSLFTEWCS